MFVQGNYHSMDDVIKDNDIDDDHQRPSFAITSVTILYYCITILIWLPVSTVCFPFFVLGYFIWGKPPMMPTWSSYCKYFVAVFMEGKPEETIPITNRVMVFLIVLGRLTRIPVNGMCWYIDELVHSSYHKVNIEKPVFMITAPRRGSTQLYYYLADDTTNFVAPVAFEGMLPYIWVWKLSMPILERLGMREYLSKKSLFGKETTKYHRFSILKPETWDGMLHSWHFGWCSYSLGVSFMNWGHSLARLQEPIDEDIVRSFVPFTDSVMKKVMYYRGKPQQHVLLKGHFLLSAREFEQQYPTAKFFVALRNPVARLNSYISFLKVMSEESKKLQGFCPTTWRVIRDHVIQTQIPYCKQEMSFYKDLADNKLALPFTSYVNDLSATLQSIYSLCNIPIPDHVMSNAIRIQHTTHDYTKHKASYDPKFKRNLASLGVDEEKLKEHLSEYIEWLNSLENE